MRAGEEMEEVGGWRMEMGWAALVWRVAAVRDRRGLRMADL